MAVARFALPIDAPRIQSNGIDVDVDVDVEVKPMLDHVAGPVMTNTGPIIRL